MHELVNFAFVHFPLVQNAHTEFSDYGLYLLLRRHRDIIQIVVAGHTHK
jgi:hypothetical protein